MIANMLWNINSRLKCCNMVGCHLEVLYDSINSLKSVVSWHTSSIFIEKRKEQSIVAGRSMYSFIRLQWMEASGSQLVESDTQTGTTSMTETLINRTYVVGDSWNLATAISWSLFTTPMIPGVLLRRWASLNIKTVYRRLATGTPHRTLEARLHGSWSVVQLQTPTHSLLFTHRQPVS